ncbi:MAG: PadR family transcriptional regulator [Candidatus Binatia bacterium]|nr:PadR family transcriptional regulator [Candidatus Binatia bacterium]
MALKYAVLEILTDGPLHGYAIRAVLSERIGSFWPMNQGQVYATLDRLDRDGLADSFCGATAGESRKFYEISNHGRAALEVWRTHPESERPNDGLGFDDWIAQLAVAHRFAEPNLVREAIGVQRRRCEALLRSIEQRTSEAARGNTAPRAAREILAAELDWLEIVLRELAPDTSPTAPAA